MQSTASSTTAQSDILKNNMQPQPAQNMIMTSNKKKKYTQQAPPPKQPQLNNQQFQINKSFNVVSISKTPSATLQQQQPPTPPAQQQQQHQQQQQQSVTQSYANVVNRSMPPVMCGSNVVTVKSCPMSSSDISSTTLFNLSHRGPGNNNNANDSNAHLPGGYVGAADVGGGGGSNGSGSTIGGGGGGILALTNSSAHGGSTIGITLGAAGGTYSHEKGIVGLNVSCIDSRKYDFKANKLLTNNSFHTTQEYVPATSTNTTGNVRANQQSGGMFRGPPASPAPRSAARHLPMQTMYQPAMHQGVVLPFSHAQYQPRQPQYQATPYSYSQPIPSNYYPSFQYYPTIQQQQAHQRGAVGVNAGVGVGSAMSVQTGPNGQLTGPSGASQTQIPIPTGAVITSAVSAGSGAVLGVSAPATGQQVGVSSMVSVMQTTVPTQPTHNQSTSRLRPNALKIIDPVTNKNILEDLDLPKNNTNTDVDFTEQGSSVQQTMQNELSMSALQTEHPTLGLSSGVIVMAAEPRSNLQYNLELHQMSQQRDMVVGQTPVVSAMSDAPSVEILPTPQKPRNKKILSILPPKETQNVLHTSPQTTENLKQETITSATTTSTIRSNSETEISINSDCVQQLQQEYQTTEVPHGNTEQQYLPGGEGDQQKHLDNTVKTPIANSDISNETHQTVPEISETSCKPSVQQQPSESDSSNSVSAPDIHLSSMQLTKEETTNIIICDEQKATAPTPLPPENTVVLATIETDVNGLSINEVPQEQPATIVAVKSTKNKDTFTVHSKDCKHLQNTNMLLCDRIIPNSSSTVTSTEDAEVNGVSNSSVEVDEIQPSPTIAAEILKETEDPLINEAAANVSAIEQQNTSNINRSILNVKTGQRVTNLIMCDNIELSSPSTPDQKSCKKHTDQSIEHELSCKENVMQTENGRTEKCELPKQSPTTSATSDAIDTNTVSVPSSTDNIETTAIAAEVVKGVQPLINYNDGQWSPKNPTGKKQYDREQLMQLREAKASRIQPEVSNISILPQPNLMPSFVRTNNKRVQSMVGSIGSHRGGEGGSANFGSKQSSMSGVNSGSNSMKAGMIHINLSLNQDVKLNETDNAWRPRILVKSGGGEPVVADTETHVDTKREKDDLVRRVRGILNKLTPEKFDSLVEEIIQLKIDTPEKMRAVMVLVFEKAIDEPNFSVSYARLCHRLITEVKALDEEQRMESGTKSNLVHFRNALLDKTEREFTQNVTQSSAKEKRLQPIIEKIKKSGDPIEKAELEALLEEEERKIRRRSGGTVRFIGELFKISMLTGKIIQSCISTLLNPKSEDMLECLCKLLTTVGAKYEQTPINSKEPAQCYSLEPIMSRMQSIASKADKDGSKVSSRVRFMLQDVIDLRKNKWASTRNEAPKTMGQIEKETKTEQLSSHYLNYGSSVSAAGGSGSNASQMSSGKRDDRGGRFGDQRSSSGYGGSHSQRGDSGSLRRQQQGGNSGSSYTNHSNGNNDDSTWHVQTSKGGRSQVVDSNKLEGLLTQNLDNKKMGGVLQFTWNNAQRSTPTTTPSNSFAALSSLVDSNKSNDRDRDRDRDRSGPRNKGSYSKGSMERDRYGDRGMHYRTGSSQASRENSSSRGSQPVRGIINSSSMQKSASHSKYSQQIPSSRIAGKIPGISSMTSGSGTLYPPHRVESANNVSLSSPHNQTEAQSNAIPIAAPAAVFEEPTDTDSKVIKSIVAEMIEIAVNSKAINSSIIPCINRIRESQRCSFLFYILTDYLHLAYVGQLYRRHLSNIVDYLIQQNFLSVDHFKLAYEHFCELASDLIFDIPELWLYIFEFTGPLLAKKIISLNDLWNKQLRNESSPSFSQKFLKTFLTYCLREIGPSFTRSMWKKSNMKWTDFIPENEVENFIQINKFEYVDNEMARPDIDLRETKEKRINRVVERIDHMLKEGANADFLMDYINGNIVDIDKQFIRNLTEKLCSFVITFKDGSYKLVVDTFQKVCIPVLQRYIDTKEDRELECLYSMQLLINSLEHPRGLLGDFFGELYDSDVIHQDSFKKWRDSKDPSAGKGVAVKGTNSFFSLILSGEISDENN